MLKALSPAAALLAALALAGPAAAQGPAAPNDTTPAPVCSGIGEDDPGTCTSGDQGLVGDGQVVTDPADQIDGPTAPDDGDRPADEPKQGELHVLGNAATSSSPAPAPQSSAPAQAAAASQPAARPVAATRKTLPFTGVDARPLALMGLALLLGGWLLRRRLDETA